MIEGPEKNTIHQHIEKSDNRLNENGKIKQTTNEDIVLKNKNYENISKKEEDKKSNSNICCCDDECIGILFGLSTKFIKVSFFPNLILLIGLYVSYIKNKECQAEIYPKMILIYGLSGILICLPVFGSINFCCNTESNCLEIYLYIFHIFDKIISFGLTLFLLIFTHYYYISSSNWENCGSVKGWLTYALVIM